MRDHAAGFRRRHGLDLDRHLLPGIGGEAIAEVEPFRGFEERLVLVQLVALVVEELVEHDDGARCQPGIV